MLPYNMRDDKAKIHAIILDEHEVWIHHRNGNIEFLKSYDNRVSALACIVAYNGQSASIGKM